VTNSLNVTRHKDRGNQDYKGDPIGPPPDYIASNEAAAAILHEIIDLIPPGIAYRADRLLIEATVRAVFMVRSKDCNAAALLQLRGCLTELGLSPASRARLMTSAAERVGDPAMNYFTG